jgi:flagellar biosynthesis protein FliQ
MGSSILQFVPLLVLIFLVIFFVKRVIKNRKKTNTLKTAYEEALKSADKQNEINAGLAYYKHISKRFIGCIILWCFILGWYALVGIAILMGIAAASAENAALSFIPSLIILVFPLIFLFKRTKYYKTEKESMKELMTFIEAQKEAEKAQREKERAIKASSESYFDGGLLSLIGWKILGFFITLFTLGICYPLALCMVYGWEMNHTVINGKRLKFNGKAVSLFGHWILWVFLSIITLGIYILWLNIALKKWVVKNTTFEETEN